MYWSEIFYILTLVLFVVSLIMSCIVRGQDQGTGGPGVLYGYRRNVCFLFSSESFWVSCGCDAGVMGLLW